MMATGDKIIELQNAFDEKLRQALGNKLKESMSAFEQDVQAFETLINEKDRELALKEMNEIQLPTVLMGFGKGDIELAKKVMAAHNDRNEQGRTDTGTTPEGT